MFDSFPNVKCARALCNFNLKFSLFNIKFERVKLVLFANWKRAVIDDEEWKFCRKLVQFSWKLEFSVFHGFFTLQKSPRVTSWANFWNEISLAKVKAGRASNFHQICSCLITRRNLITFNFFFAIMIWKFMRKLQRISINTRKISNFISVADLFALDAHRQWFMSDFSSQIAFWILNYFRLYAATSIPSPLNLLNNEHFPKITLHFIHSLFPTPSIPSTFIVWCKLWKFQQQKFAQQWTFHLFLINNECWSWSLNDWVSAGKL